MHAVERLPFYIAANKRSLGNHKSKKTRKASVKKKGSVKVAPGGGKKKSSVKKKGSVKKASDVGSKKSPDKAKAKAKKKKTKTKTPSSSSIPDVRTCPCHTNQDMRFVIPAYNYTGSV